MPEPKKRTRSATGQLPVNDLRQPEPAPPPTETKSTAITTPIPIQFEDSTPALHSVIQGIAGPYLGVLAMIGEIRGSIYKCYLILPQNRRESFEIKASECAVIGKPKKAARNPFAVTQVPQPDVVHRTAQPSFDDPTSEI
jgi:hypothetical protein